MIYTVHTVQLRTRLLSVNALVAVGNVQKEILLVVLLVQRAHGRARRRNDVVHEEEERVLGPQMDSLSDQEVELANSQIRRYQILLLVQIANARLGRFLHDHGNTIGILFPYLLALGATLLERMLLFVLELHLYLASCDEWCRSRDWCFCLLTQ